MRISPLLLAATALAALFFAACGDDQCSRVCAPGQACVVSGGQELCLEANCGGLACAPEQTCQDNVCVSDTCSDCSSAQHCVSGICVQNYTSSNVCTPLSECRTGCGTNAACLAACEDDQSNTCTQCLATQAQCMSRESCDPAGPGTGCCVDQYCACFPSASGCGEVADCTDCQVACGDDVEGCFNDCRASDLACNLCLEPLDDCLADGGGAAGCSEFLCDCVDPELEEACQ